MRHLTNPVLPVALAVLAAMLMLPPTSSADSSRRVGRNVGAGHDRGHARPDRFRGRGVYVEPYLYGDLFADGDSYFYQRGPYFRPYASGLVGGGAAPAGAVLSTLVPGYVSPYAQQLFVYPKAGQSEGQLAADRAACERWAADQTLPGARFISSSPAIPQTDYGRALTACLEARSYSVR